MGSASSSAFSFLPSIDPGDAGADVLSIRVSRDLDVASETRSRADLAEVCGAARAQWMLLLFRRGIFVDVRGLAVLLDAAAAARRHGRQLIMVSPPRCLTRMIDVLGLHDRLTTASTTSEVTARLLGCSVGQDRHVYADRVRRLAGPAATRE